MYSYILFYYILINIYIALSILTVKSDNISNKLEFIMFFFFLLFGMLVIPLLIIFKYKELKKVTQYTVLWDLKESILSPYICGHFLRIYILIVFSYHFYVFYNLLFSI